MPEPTDQPFRAAGYTVVLPPGWVRIPANSGDTDKRLDDAIDSALPPDLPRDEAVRLKVKIKGRLLAAVAESTEIGALDLYLPIQGMHGHAIPASFLVSEIPIGAGREADEAARELQAKGAEPMPVDGVTALRLDDLVPPDSLMTDVEVPARRITYLVPVPGAPRWLAVSFSTIGDGDPSGEFAELLVGLFDAIMTTFRWSA